MTPKSRNSPLLENGSITRVLWRCGFVQTDLVQNALSMSTESTNILHRHALDYIRIRAQKNGSFIRPITRSVRVEGKTLRVQQELERVLDSH
jgi:hypothetical protein